MNDAINIFVDADALVALTVETDANHEKARSLLNRMSVNPVLFLTSNVRDHRVNSFKINDLIFDILPYEFVNH